MRWMPYILAPGSQANLRISPLVVGSSSSGQRRPGLEHAHTIALFRRAQRGHAAADARADHDYVQVEVIVTQGFLLSSGRPGRVRGARAPRAPRANRSYFACCLSRLASCSFFTSSGVSFGRSTLYVILLIVPSNGNG